MACSFIFKVPFASKILPLNYQKNIWNDLNFSYGYIVFVTLFYFDMLYKDMFLT